MHFSTAGGAVGRPSAFESVRAQALAAIRREGACLARAAQGNP
jgi:hypothetical protein